MGPEWAREKTPDDPEIAPAGCVALKRIRVRFRYWVDGRLALQPIAWSPGRVATAATRT